MPTTGTDFDKIIDWKSGRNYSAYFSPTQKNATIKEATIKYIDLLYATNDKQRIADELFSIYKTEAVFTPVNNQLYLQTQTVPVPNTIPDYNHILSVLVTQVENIISTISDTAATSPIRVTVAGQNNLRDFDKVLISGVLGNIATNGVRYLKQLGTYLFALYADERLTVPITGNFPYLGGGTLKRYVSTYAQDNRQSESALGKPSLYYPKYEVANGVIKFLPLNIAVSTVSMDYVSKPTVFIDVTDSAINLELSYSIRCISGIAEETIRLLGMDSRDPSQQQNAQSELIQQP